MIIIIGVHFHLFAQFHDRSLLHFTSLGWRDCGCVLCLCSVCALPISFHAKWSFPYVWIEMSIKYIMSKSIYIRVYYVATHQFDMYTHITHCMCSIHMNMSGYQTKKRKRETKNSLCLSLNMSMLYRMPRHTHYLRTDFF